MPTPHQVRLNLKPKLLKSGVRTPITCFEAGEQTGISNGRDLTIRSHCAILVSDQSDSIDRSADHQDGTSLRGKGFRFLHWGLLVLPPAQPFGWGAYAICDLLFNHQN